MRSRIVNNSRVLLTAAALVFSSSTILAAELTVTITGSKSTLGKMGCALYASADGFPFDTKKANAQVVPVDATVTKCVFSNLAPGTYAVGVVHDLNGNEKVDTNFLGVPTESWAVSKNISHRLRAPTFDEASFKLENNLQIDLRLVQGIGILKALFPSAAVGSSREVSSRAIKSDDSLGDCIDKTATQSQKHL